MDVESARSAALSEYAESHGVDQLLTELAHVLMIRRPANPIQHTVRHLQRRYPDLTDPLPPLEAASAGILARPHDGEEDSDEDVPGSEDQPPLEPLDEFHFVRVSDSRRGRRRSAHSLPPPFGAASLETPGNVDDPPAAPAPGSLQDAFLSALASAGALESVPPQDYLAVLELAQVRDEEEGVILCREGDASLGMWVVVDGRLTMERDAGSVNEPGTSGTSEKKRVDYVHKGEGIGWAALRDAWYRWPATVCTMSPSQLLFLPRDYFSAKLALRARRRWSVRFDALSSSPWFSFLSPSDVGRVADASEEWDGPAGGVLARQGFPGDAAFIVLQGTVALVQQPTPTDAPVEMCRLGPGGSFGLPALLFGRPYHMSAIALGGTTAGSHREKPHAVDPRAFPAERDSSDTGDDAVVRALVIPRRRLDRALQPEGWRGLVQSVCPERWTEWVSALM